MSRAGHQRERRCEVRRPAPANHVAWAQEQATSTHPGWVNDVAASSISFVTPKRDRPSPGQAIELTFDPGSPSPRHRLVRVVRADPYDRFFSIVGCRDELAD